MIGHGPPNLLAFTVGILLIAGCDENTTPTEQAAPEFNVELFLATINATTADDIVECRQGRPADSGGGRPGGLSR